MIPSNKYTFEVKSQDNKRIGFFYNPNDECWYYGEIMPESNAVFAHIAGPYNSKAQAYEAAQTMYTLPKYGILRRFGIV